MPTTPVLNPEPVRALADSLDVGFAIQLIDTFLEDSPHLITQIERGIREGDATTVHGAVHTLKSHSHTFGLMQLAPMCEELERLTVSDGLSDHTSRIARDLVTAYESAAQALKGLQEELARA